MFLSRVRTRYICCERTRDSPVLPFGGATIFFARHNEKRNEREALSGVPIILRPLREPGVIEGPAAAATVLWPPPGPASAQEPRATGLSTGPAPAQQAQCVMYNAGRNGSHFIDEGTQDEGGG